MINKLKNDKILIGGWVSPPPKEIFDRDYINEKSYLEIKEAGLDFIHSLYENEYDILRALKVAEKTGVKIFVQDQRFYKKELTIEEENNVINKYLKYSSFAGLDIKDEPGSDYFKDIKEIMDRHEGINYYINLLPIYAVSSQLKDNIWLEDKSEATEEEYIDYLQKYVEILPLNQMSYDFYPFRWGYGEIDKRYFIQLYLSKKYADLSNAPLWNFVQVASFKNEIRCITKEEIYWCVTTSLVYGVTCLQYFTYFTPTSGEIEQFSGAMVEKDGSLSDRYYIVKEINEHLNALGSDLVSAKFKGVLINGEYLGQIPSASIVSQDDIVIEGKDYLVGVFEKDGKNVWYIMNQSLKEDSSLKISFSFKKNRRVVIGIKEEIKDIKELKITLEKGRGMLVSEAIND